MNSALGRFAPIVAILAVGIIALFLGISIGHADDAPGAGMIDIVLFLGSLFFAFRIYRRRA